MTSFHLFHVISLKNQSRPA
uniref:Uncharacterized protein n=1 Tax=Anguilla anguilla TaxID=7936 RepID=A0A0E9PDM4_ANGAN